MVSSGRPVGAVPARDLAREDPAHGPVDVARPGSGPSLTDSRRSERRRAPAHELPVERVVEHRLLGDGCGAAASPGGTSGDASTIDRSTRRAFQWSIASSMSSRSIRPIMSSKRRKPERRHDLAGRPRRRASGSRPRARASRAKRARSSGSWVAIPTGQVFRWQTRIMMQPIAISGAVEKPHSSAPSSAADDHVAPGAHPAVDLDQDPRAQVVARAASAGSRRARSPTGTPPTWIEDCGEAPVPPSWPAISHVVGIGLRDARRDRPDADLGDQLDRRPSRSGWRTAGRRSAA